MNHSTKAGRVTPPLPRFYSLELPSWASSPAATDGASSRRRPVRRRLWRTKRHPVGEQQ